jgi:hypothetical protein
LKILPVTRFKGLKRRLVTDNAYKKPPVIMYNLTGSRF